MVFAAVCCVAFRVALKRFTALASLGVSVGGGEPSALKWISGGFGFGQGFVEDLGVVLAIY